MSIDALGSNSTSSTLEFLKELRAAKKAMEAAVQSGDMKSAQQSLATVQQDAQSLQAARGTSANAQDSNPYRSLLKTDLSNLMSAVQGGNLDAAQSALQTFQQDRQAVPGPNDASFPAASSSGNPFLDDLKALLTSALSGDTSGMQTAATALQKDLQSASGDATASGTQATDAATAATDQTQNPFLGDLSKLIDAAQSNDTAGMQTAAKDLAHDIQSAVGSVASAHVGGHHHHHHHQSVDTGTSTDTTSDSTTAAAPAVDGDGEKDGQAGTAAPASITSSALKNAKEAYDLLMSFSQEPTGTTL
jgi:ribosomal protein S20